MADDDNPYESASLVGARLCKRCGCYVSGLRLSEHEHFHHMLDAAQPPKKGKKQK